MSKRKTILATAAAAILIGGWYLFRPELLFINTQVHETLSDSGHGVDQLLVTGRFHSVAHETKGRATIHLLADGRRILRLTDFATSNGPDVRILLVAANDATDHAMVSQADSVDLGALKGNLGEQNYDIPVDVDLGKYRSVTIWCRRFRVNFGTAPVQDRHNNPVVERIGPAV
jgi:hypothetical protein